MKICVYAICKNEANFIERWYESVKEADEIYVLDTGSTDDSVKIFKNLGINVKRKNIIPWRFDVARNESLKMVPTNVDICVCLDLDEIISKGWRKKLEELWKNNTTRLRYNYNWKLDKNNNPEVNFYIDKIHIRNGYSWIYPVHEVLKCNKTENFLTTDEIIVNHYPDDEKSRGSYLELLELSVKENPNDDRNVHYLGREYMYHQKWNKCIDTLIKHLNLKTAVWTDERSASMRFIARAYTNLKRYDEAKMWLKYAIKEAPHLRDPLIEMALLQYQLGNWKEIDKYCYKALKIKTHQKTYINEIFSWNYTVYDLLAISSYYQNKVDNSIKWINKAIKLDPNNERLIKNKQIFKIRNQRIKTYKESL